MPWPWPRSRPPPCCHALLRSAMSCLRHTLATPASTHPPPPLGCVLFMVSAYILFLNPLILSGGSSGFNTGAQEGKALPPGDVGGEGGAGCSPCLETRACSRAAASAPPRPAGHNRRHPAAAVASWRCRVRELTALPRAAWLLTQPLPPSAPHTLLAQTTPTRDAWHGHCAGDGRQHRRFHHLDGPRGQLPGRSRYYLM